MVLEQLVEAVGNQVRWKMQAQSSASTQPIEVTGLVSPVGLKGCE